MLTGTGIVPPDDFSLIAGDMVRITIDGIGTLANPVVQRRCLTTPRVGPEKKRAASSRAEDAAAIGSEWSLDPSRS